MSFDSDSSVERTVRGLLGAAVGTGADNLSATATLAECGLDSLSAIRLAHQLSAACHARVALTDLLGNVTVAGLVETVRAAQVEAPTTSSENDSHTQTDGVSSTTPTITPIQAAYFSGRGTDFPLGGVASWWYHEYHRPTPGSGCPEIDIATLEVAWRRVVAHHDMLRTIITRDGMAEVATHDVRDFAFTRIDLRDTADVDEAIADIRRETSHQLRPSHVWPLFDIQVALLPDGSTRWFVGFDVLVIDFTSWGLIMDQWGQLAAHPEQQLPDPGATFAELLAARHAGPEFAAARTADAAWWADQVIPAAPQLPWDNVPAHGARFTRHQNRVDPRTWDAVQAQAKHRGVSATSVVLTAFAGALARRSNAGDFTVNVTVFDRPLDDSATGVVGDFTTTTLMPFRADDGFDTDSAASFAELALTANRTLWDCLEHRAVSGVEVARERGDRSAWPVVFTSGLGTPSGEADRWLGVRDFGVSQTPQVLLDHLVWEENGELVITIDAVDSALPEGFADRLLDAELTWLATLADDPAWELPGPFWDPSGHVRAQALTVLHSGSGIHDPWRDAALTDGAGPAVRCGGKTLTHTDLLAAAQDLAAQLVALGVKPGALLMVAFPKGFSQIIAVMAVELTGAGYVPVDPSWPVRRKQSIRNRTGLGLALVHDASVELPEEISALVLDESGRVTGPVPTVSPADVSPPDPAATDGSAHCRDVPLAYTIFTSGSTGEPKGVAITHDQARCTIDEINNRFHVTATDRVLGLSALSFDLSVYDIFGVLGVGGTLVLPEQGRDRDPGYWLDLIADEGVTIWNTAPALLEMFIEFAEYDDRAKEKLASLRLVMLSGDWIPVTLPERVWALAPQVEFHSLGGATEAAIWSINYPVKSVDPDWPSVPYGRPLPEQAFLIMADELRPCRVGEVGELLIGGHGVASGYIGDPERSGKQFIKHPQTGERLYRTGDEGRWRPDSTIQFLGRIDRQVKINGHRIELGEVEAAMHRLPQVRQAAVLAMPGPDGRARLVAHYSLSGDATDAGDLASVLTEQVPSYMVPQRFVELPSLPMSANGKIDTKALKNPWDRSGASQPVAPAGAHGVDPSASAVGSTPAEAVNHSSTAAGATVLPFAAAGSPATAGDSSGEPCFVQNNSDQASATPTSAGQASRGVGVRPQHATASVSGQGAAQLGDASTAGTDAQAGADEAGASGLRVPDALARIVTAEHNLATSPLKSGLSSLDLVRLANAVEDATGSRPDMVSLMGDTALADLLAQWFPGTATGSGTASQARNGQAAGGVADASTPQPTVSGVGGAAYLGGAGSAAGVSPSGDTGQGHPVASRNGHAAPRQPGGTSAGLSSATANGGSGAAAAAPAAGRELAVPDAPLSAVAALAANGVGLDMSGLTAGAFDPLIDELRQLAATLEAAQEQSRHVVARLTGRYAEAPSSNGHDATGNAHGNGAGGRPAHVVDHGAGGTTRIGTGRSRTADWSGAHTAAGFSGLSDTRHRTGHGVNNGTPASADGETGEFPLTEMQLAYLVGRAPDQHGRTLAPHYYTDARVTGLDPDRFEQAWRTVVARHPMLRAVTAGSAAQRVLPVEQANCRVERADLRGRTTTERDAWLTKYRARCSHRQLPTDTAPMIRWAAAQVTDTDWVLCFDVDLLFCDAASASQVIAEVVAEYAEPGRLGAPVAAAFGEYAAAERSPRPESAQYWRNRVADLPHTGPTLPKPAVPVGVAQVERHRAVLSPAGWAELRQCAQAAGTTPTVVLLDALGEALCGPAREHAAIILTVDDRPEGHVGVVGDYTATVVVDVDHRHAHQAPADRRRRLQVALAEGLHHGTGTRGVHGNSVLRDLRARHGSALDLPVVVSSALGKAAASGTVADPAAVDASQLLDGLGETAFAISQTPGIVLDVQLFEVAGQLRVNWDADVSVVDSAWVQDRFTAWCRRVTDGLSTQFEVTTGTRVVPTPSAARASRSGIGQAGGGADVATVRADVVAALAAAAQVSDPSPTASWFDLGATSVSLVAMHRDLSSRGYTLSMVDVFTYPSVGALAEFLARPSGGASDGVAPGPAVGEDDGTEQTGPQGNGSARGGAGSARRLNRSVGRRAGHGESLSDVLAAARTRGSQRTVAAPIR